MLHSPNVAPPVGPVLGGVLAAKLGWKWIFRFLCILGGVCLILIAVAFPETSRVIVGNGSVPAQGIVYKTLVPRLVEPAKQHRDIEAEGTTLRPKFTFPNPLMSLKLLFEMDVAAVLLCNGIFYTIYCCIQASLSTLFIQIYEYESLESGLIYIPFGVACLVSTLSWGSSSPLPPLMSLTCIDASF